MMPTGVYHCLPEQMDFNWTTHLQMSQFTLLHGWLLQDVYAQKIINFQKFTNLFKLLPIFNSIHHLPVMLCVLQENTVNQIS